MNKMNLSCISAVSIILVLCSAAWSANITDENIISFQPNTPAHAQEVNNNFNVTKNAINDNNTKIDTHSADSSIHHSRYTDSEAVSAMGSKSTSNALNHDRYTNSEAVTAVINSGIDGHSLNAADGSPQNMVFVDNNGLVGIGTQTPIYDLHVLGLDNLATLAIMPNIAAQDSELRLSENPSDSYGMSIRYDGLYNILEIYGYGSSGEYGPHLSIERDSGTLNLNGQVNLNAPLVISGPGALVDNPTCVYATNTSGATLYKTMIVILDASNTTNEICVTTTTDSQHFRSFGVVFSPSISNNSQGLIAVSGVTQVRIRTSCTAGTSVATWNPAGTSAYWNDTTNAIGKYLQTVNTSAQTSAWCLLNGGM